MKRLTLPPAISFRWAQTTWGATRFLPAAPLCDARIDPAGPGSRAGFDSDCAACVRRGPCALRTTTLCLSLPWIFLFIILRAVLPLNTRPLASILITFGLMGIAGWAWPARIFTASIRGIMQAGWLLQARAGGISPWRIWLVQVWPHLRAIAIAQFRVLIPSYILSEASLGLLGLGVAEPLPSWGNLLAELEHSDRVHDNPWILAPLALLDVGDDRA